MNILFKNYSKENGPDLFIHNSLKNMAIEVKSFHFLVTM